MSTRSFIQNTFMEHLLCSRVGYWLWAMPGLGGQRSCAGGASVLVERGRQCANWKAFQWVVSAVMRNEAGEE